VAGAVTERTRALAKVLEEKAFQIFERLDDAFPCTRLALAASGFQELPSQVRLPSHHCFKCQPSLAHTPNGVYLWQSTIIANAH
jgi:hypothetical protein